MAKKKIKIDEDCKIIEETEYYIVTEREKAKGLWIYSKFDDSIFVCDNYWISGLAIVKEKDNKLTYHNLENWQLFGKGKALAHTIHIDACEKRLYKGEEVLLISYRDENDRKYVRGVDANGDLFKREKGYKFEKIVEQTAGI